MSVKQVNLGNLQRKLYKRLNSSFLCSGFPKMSKPKTKTVGIWTGERSSCSVTKLYNYSETNYPFKVNIEVKCVNLRELKHINANSK